MVKMHKFKKPLGTLVAAFAITLGAFATVVPASAAPAPSNLVVASGEEEIFNTTEITSADTISIERGGKLFICTGMNGHATIDASITFSNTGSGANPSLTVEACMGADGQAPFSTGATLNGAVVLNTDATLDVSWGSIKMNGSLTSNGNDLTTIARSGARIVGTGTLGSVQVGANGRIMPGNSPGILNTGDLTLEADSNYDFEVGGTTPGTGHDQINVTGTVSVAGNLVVTFWDDFTPTTGQTFVIINNDGADAVTGTFAGLAEGEEFEVAGQLFTISYVGGDGNDIVLESQGAAPVAPGAPDTGFALALANPAVIVLAGIVATGVILFIARSLRSSQQG